MQPRWGSHPNTFLYFYDRIANATPFSSRNAIATELDYIHGTKKPRISARLFLHFYNHIVNASSYFSRNAIATELRIEWGYFFYCLNLPVGSTNTKVPSAANSLYPAISVLGSILVMAKAKL
jgi:hypothetical protein